MRCAYWTASRRTTMRHARAAGALWLVLVLYNPVSAGVAPDYRVVNVDQAEVRARPSSVDAQVYVTNRLRRGTPVKVFGEEEGGWLKIAPPEGSFSWINTR